jgi:hypothetical protein
MEFFLVGFALLIAKNHHSATTLWIGALIALLLLLTAGLLSSIRGWIIGSLLQIALIAYGVVVPLMYFLGVLFAILWVCAYILGKKGEAARAAFTTGEK